MELLFLVGPVVLTVVALWRWKRDAYKHVMRRWRRIALVIGLAANLVAQAIFWGGNLFLWSHPVGWTLGEIVPWLRVADTAACGVALTGSIIGDGDGRFALGAASIWLAFVWGTTVGTFL